MASWDDDEFVADVKVATGAAKDSWEDEDAEEEPKPEAPKTNNAAPKAKSKKKKKDELYAAKGAEESSEAGLTPKEVEDRAKARDLALMQDLMGAPALSLSLDFALDDASWMADAAKCGVVSSAIKDLLPADSAKPDDYHKFLEVLFEKLCLDLPSTHVKKLSTKLKTTADVLRKTNDDKERKAGGNKKNLPGLASGKGRGGDAFDDFGDGSGGYGAADDDDFM